MGLAKNFKNRYSKHKTSMTKPTPKNSTTLSTHFLKEKRGGYQPKVSWKFLESNLQTFKPVTGNCKLCLMEKYHISFNPTVDTRDQNCWPPQTQTCWTPQTQTRKVAEMRLRPTTDILVNPLICFC